MLEFLFTSSLFMIIYIYLGYPVLVFLISLKKNKKIETGNFFPFVSIVIAAFNEEECIGDTLKNKLDLDYPGEKLEILVVSDESSDRTDEIVKQYEPRNVKLLRQVPRAGKTSALNMAAQIAKGEIIVFSDANSIYARDALKRLLSNFCDPTVGYVTGKMVYTNLDGSITGEGCSAYMKYENMLRECETKIGSIVGADGGIDAVRKNLYHLMNPDQLPDFVLPLKIVEQGFRVVYEPGAILNEPSLRGLEDEYKMRLRVSLRALWAMSDMRQLLSFKQFGIFAWQLWSHKLLRYFCFVFLLIAFISNLLLWPENNFYRLSFMLQMFAYLGAYLSTVLNRSNNNFRVLSFFHYFVLINFAAAHAVVKYILGQKMVTWSPRKG